jgi:hypothetical protein
MEEMMLVLIHQPTLSCDFKLCHVGEFLCDDRDCLLTNAWNEQYNNGRDLFFHRNVFRFNFSNDDGNSKNISFEIIV